MVDSVKSIPADPLGKPLVWSWVDEGGFRQTAVKAGVKHGHLRHGTKRARDDLNPFQLGAVMERCKCCHARDRGLQPRRDERSEEHTSELQSRLHLVCRLLLEKKKKDNSYST